MKQKIFLWLCAAVMGIIPVGVIFWQGALWLSAANKPPLIGKAYNRVETVNKAVALTFDDGPNPPHTLSILDTLSKYQVKATFFMVGKYVSEFPHVVERIMSEGHQIGNHTWSHKDLIFRSPWFVKSEIIKTDNILRSIGYNDEIFFRSPRGRKLIVLPWILSGMNRPNILFDVVAMDWENLPVEVMSGYVLNHVRPGSIILLHDGDGDRISADRSATVQLTGIVIDHLKKGGFEFVTVSELLN